jgi:hypothetical protein
VYLKRVLFCLRFKAFLDLPDVVRVLSTIGFAVRWLDASAPGDVKQVGDPGQEQRCGCRVVVTCTKSGLRAVLEMAGEECTCSERQLDIAADIQVPVCGIDFLSNSLEQ